MIPKIVRLIGWTAAGLAGLAAALYLVALAVNWRDREPSDAVVQLDRLWRDRPVVADSDNAFIYVMGFDAAASEDPAVAGLRRVEWIRSATAAGTLNAADDPLPERRGTVDPPAIQQVLESCHEGKAECVALYEGGTAAFEEWVAAQGPLLERYQRLIAHPEWSEMALRDLRQPLPSYSSVLAGQRLLLLDVRVLVERGEVALAKDLLANDLRFWRTVLGSSDLLITKMIAAAAIRLHFERGSLALRGRQGGSTTAAMPDEWRVAFVGADLSVRRALVGEWTHASHLLQQGIFDPGAGATLADKAIARLYQRQDTLNRFADYDWQAAEILDAPLDRYAAAVQEALLLSEQARPDGFRLYNWTGTTLMAGGVVDFGDYAARAADVEGIRRGALAAVTLRADGVLPADVPAALRTTAPRNPYDGEPLLWDEGRNAIVFRGLERSDRREHRFFY